MYELGMAGLLLKVLARQIDMIAIRPPSAKTGSVPGRVSRAVAIIGAIMIEVADLDSILTNGESRAQRRKASKAREEER
jgi:hypothetical protein